MRERAGKAACDRAKQREAGDRDDQRAGQHHEKTDDCRAEYAGHEVEDASPDRRAIAFAWIRIGILAHADRCSNGGQVIGKSAKGRQQHPGEAGPADQRRRGRLVAVGSQHREPGKILRCHRHDEKRNPHPQHGRKRKIGSHPDRMRDVERDCVGVDKALQHGRHQTGDQGQGNGIARQYPAANKVAGKHQSHQQALRGQDDKNVEPETQQHARQHGGRKRRRHMAHDPVKRA